MAEHDEKFFEHEFSEKFMELDKNIKIPEIPDVQNIFDKAEATKTNVVPLKKYSRYVAAAAAVVLICVSIPILTKTFSGAFFAQEAAQEPMAFWDPMADSAVEEAEMEAEPGEPIPETAEEPLETEMSESETNSDGKTNDINDGLDYRYVFTTALEEFFSTNDSTEKNELKEQSSAMSSSAVEPETMVGGDGNLIELKLNKKRSIEVSVEKDSVSVRLFDNSAGGEIISAFWVEGTFENAYKDEEFYVIDLVKTISPEELEEGLYLPMAGDPINGTYIIPEESVVVSEKITRGAIHLSVKIDIGTGEYQIYASLI